MKPRVAQVISKVGAEKAKETMISLLTEFEKLRHFDKYYSLIPFDVPSFTRHFAKIWEAGNQRNEADENDIEI
jgi:hypothetical protein